MLINALPHLLGYGKVEIEEIKRFRQLGSITPGHPENFHTPGVETTPGLLAQSRANAVGMAIAELHLAAVFGPELVDHRTYVLASDGDLMEGVSQEAIALAGHLRLNKLIVLFDDNGISIDGPLSLADSVDQVKRFEAAGWAARRIDGHDAEAVAAALEEAQSCAGPSLIACRTIIGFGAPTKAGSEKTHGSPLGSEEIKGARERLGWAEPAFAVPGDVREMWRSAGCAGRAAHQAWCDRLSAAPAVRLGALAGERVIYVMTHDSIGLGEDGPTHQPIEHLAALRAMPNLYVFRPCDAVETIECWELALQNSQSPSVLALTRQNVPQLRLWVEGTNPFSAGAYA